MLTRFRTKVVLRSVSRLDVEDDGGASGDSSSKSAQTRTQKSEAQPRVRTHHDLTGRRMSMHQGVDRSPSLRSLAPLPLKTRAG